MEPKLTGADHVHIDVGSWSEAEDAYGATLDCSRVEALMGWAVKNGPLTIENPEATVHLALFESGVPKPTSVVAFGASRDENLNRKSRFESRGLKLRIADHKMAYSFYFCDSWQNIHEITTYDRDYVHSRLTD